MSIVPLVKVTLYGPAAEKDAVLDGLQSLGCLHLNDLRPVLAKASTARPRTPTPTRHCSICGTAPCADARRGKGARRHRGVGEGGGRRPRPLTVAGRRARATTQVDR